MKMSSLAAARPGARKKEFIPAGTANCSCSTSSRLTKAATSISWKARPPFLNRKFIEALEHKERRDQLKKAFRAKWRLPHSVAATRDVRRRQQASERRRGKGSRLSIRAQQ